MFENSHRTLTKNLCASGKTIESLSFVAWSLVHLLKMASENSLVPFLESITG
jgi:hypothetical protein